MSSMTDEFERLAALHNEGALTDEEFAAAKQRVLSDGPEEGAEDEREFALLEAERLMELGAIERVQSNYDEASRCFEGALDVFQTHGDRHGEGRARGLLGRVCRSQGHYGRATQFHTQALDIARELGDKHTEGINLGDLGMVYQSLSQYDRARELYTQALDSAREVGNKRSEGGHLGNLGNLLFTLERLDEAESAFRQSVDIAREVGDKRREGLQLGNLGDLFFTLERLDEAEHAFRQAIAAGGQTSPIIAGVFRGSLALLLAQQGNLDEAQRLLEMGDAQVAPRPDEHAKFLCKKGQVCRLAGDADGARASLDQARALAADLKVSEDSEVAKAIRELEAVLSER